MNIPRRLGIAQLAAVARASQLLLSCGLPLGRGKVVGVRHGPQCLDAITKHVQCVAVKRSFKDFLRQNMGEASEVREQGTPGLWMKSEKPAKRHRRGCQCALG